MRKLIQQIKAPDGSIWEFDIMDVAKNRAENYKDEYKGDIEKSLTEDTIPLFEKDPYEIADWAHNQMDADDVPSLKMVKPPEANSTPQDVWMEGIWGNFKGVQDEK